nr:rubredoxin [Woeseia oceani]
MCPVDCFVYEERDGVPELGIEPGTRWQDLPCDWSCPMCGEHRAGFEPVAALER